MFKKKKEMLVVGHGMSVCRYILHTTELLSIFFFGI